MREASADRRPLGGAEEQYRLLMECVTDYAIFLLDPSGRVATWNAGAERIFGYEEADIVGQDFHRFFTPEDRERGEPERELATAVAEGRAGDECWHVPQDGWGFWAGGAPPAVGDEHGRLRGFSKVARDLTEQRRAGGVLREPDRRKDEFIAMLAHELRNML